PAPTARICATRATRRWTKASPCSSPSSGRLRRRETGRWTTQKADWAEERNIGWMAWSIGDKDESSAALKPGTKLSGWTEEDLTESGKLLRAKLREMAGTNPACHSGATVIR